MATHPAPDLWEVQGKQIDLPVQGRDASFAGAAWRPPRAAVDAQLEPYGLRSAGRRGKGLAMLVCVVYPDEFVLGGYDEVGIGVYASPCRTGRAGPGCSCSSCRSPARSPVRPVGRSGACPSG